MRLDALLTAHSYMKVQRPPELWELAIDDDGDAPLIRALGLMIVMGLLAGNELHELTLNASNVVVDETSERPPPGRYVALTVSGPGEWPEDEIWEPGAEVSPRLAEIVAEAHAADARFAYTRRAGGHGSVTVFYPAE